MESAIDTHLKCPRSLSRRVADDYQPPFPMWVGRADAAVEQVVMGYFGIQSPAGDASADGRALAALQHIVAQFDRASGPRHHDLVEFVDTEGYANRIAVAYWASPLDFARWRDDPEIDGWWRSDARLTDGIGYFREIMAPRVDQLETLYAFTDRFPGIGAVMNRASGEIEEHGYWGSMRDRMPISQVDRMQARGALEIVDGAPPSGGRVVIAGHDNLCLIRSGQDWEETEADERALYIEEIEPTLRAGMDFLRDHGQAIGCYSNRYVHFIDLDGRRREQSFDIGHWRSLDRLERWAESHPTHLRIFTTFFRVAEKLVKLRLYHEVFVFDAGDQHYEYINCHAHTGLMRDAAAAPMAQCVAETVPA